MLVNNAGIQHVAPVESFPPEKWDAIIAINLSAAFHTTRLALPAMKAKRWGRIINTASAHSLDRLAQQVALMSPPSTASPASPRRSRWKPRATAITANCISPGYVWTPLVERQIPDTMATRGLTRDAGDRTTCCSPRSRPSASSRPRKSRRWRCSCAATRPPRSPARTSASTAAGRRPRRCGWLSPLSSVCRLRGVRHRHAARGDDPALDHRLARCRDGGGPRAAARLAQDLRRRPRRGATVGPFRRNRQGGRAARARRRRSAASPCPTACTAAG